MKIDVVSTAQQSEAVLVEGKTVAVIDVLRATSVIVTALANGAAKITPAASVEEARKIYAVESEKKLVLLGGERGGEKIEGFHLGNSPLSYTQKTVYQKNIILSTTNGTLAIRNSYYAQRLVAVSFLNILFATTTLAESVSSLVIVCAGTNGGFSMDDILCAGMLIDGIAKITPVECCDLGQVAHQFFLSGNFPIKEKLKHCKHLKYLQSLGYDADIDYCLQVGLLDVLPEYHKDGFLALKE